MGTPTPASRARGRAATDPAQWARHALARALGVPDGEQVACAVCGVSPFGPGPRPKSVVLSPSFSDYEYLLNPSADIVCAGCEELLSGRPGRVPPPARTLHMCVCEEGVTILPKPADVARVLTDPPATPFVLVWATSKKRHAWLRSRRCDSERIIVGTDEGPVTYCPSTDRRLLDSVSELLSVFGRKHIEQGDYPASMVAPFPRWWLAREQVVSRRRPSALLWMLCRILPRPEDKPKNEGDPVLEQEDLDAVFVLSGIAKGSALRAKSGLSFWGGTFRHRVRRFGRLPLQDMLSRLMDELQVSVTSPKSQELVAAVATWTPERATACASSIRDRGGLLVAFAFNEVKNGK